MMRIFFLFFPFLFLSAPAYSQGCCSGGSGSPIAGGASQGVLADRQMEISLSYQHYNTGAFMVGDSDTISLFDKLSSNYLYLRLGYGITKDLTMSVESGYFINKTQIGLQNKDTITSSGIADLILFPRYSLYNRTQEQKRTEIAIGLGFKIPLGKYDDSTVVYTDPNTGKKYWTTSPPTIQPTNGANDLIFYGFLFHQFNPKFRIFSNMIYIHKGWNPLGQKFGDYASVGLFAGRTFFRKMGVVLQLKGEWIDYMKYDKNIDMLALYNIDVYSTGGSKVFIVPQLSFSHENFTVFGLGEFPIYQYVNGTQIASQFQLTAGVSYRFFTKKSKVPTSEKAE